MIKRFVHKMPQGSLTSHHRRTLAALVQCRTAALGGHKQKCDLCSNIKIQYNSCRNRHCPKCQGINKEMFTIMQEDMLLNVPYFHVVFTIPHEFNDLCLHHPKAMYDLLFSSAWHTRNTLAFDPKWVGAKTAATMILHIWSQNLMLHPHLHCIVPRGGLTSQGKWQNPKRSGPDFLFPSEVMKPIFRGFFMHRLRKLIKMEL